MYPPLATTLSNFLQQTYFQHKGYTIVTSLKEAFSQTKQHITCQTIVCHIFRKKKTIVLKDLQNNLEEFIQLLHLTNEQHNVSLSFSIDTSSSIKQILIRSNSNQPIVFSIPL